MVQNPWSLDVFIKAVKQADEIIKQDTQPENKTLQWQIFKSSTSVAANLAEFCALNTFRGKVEKLRRCIAENNETAYWLYLWKTHFGLDSEKFAELEIENSKLGLQLFRLLEAIHRQGIAGTYQELKKEPQSW